MAKILWLLRSETTLAASFNQFYQHLGTAGHQLIKLQVESETPTFDWLNQNISPDDLHIFFCDTDLRWVKKLVEAMGLLPSNPKRVLAWIFDNPHSSELDLLESSGIDEIFSVLDPVSEVALRLELRSLRCSQRAELRRQVRELLMKEARAETILSQREEFLSVCAHDLRSPLGLIQSSLSLVLQDVGTISTTQKELVERSKRQAEHGIRLVNDLLDVMSYEQGLKPDYQLVDLNSFLKELHQDYSFQAQQKNIELRYDNELINWRVLIDPDRIHQLFQNLLVNAIKFTEPGKRIFLNVLNFKGRRKADPPYPMTIVSVRDEGKGIPEEEIQKIFNRFSQIKDYSRVEGRGLGLSVAKQISHLHDGNLWVKSVEGEGSTFFVLFPHVLSEPQKLEKTSKKTTRVLIVDSDKSHSELLSAVCHRWGFETYVAKDGIEMVTFSFYHQPNIVLVGSALNKLSEEAAAEIIKKSLGMQKTAIFQCVKPDQKLVSLPENSAIDSLIKMPLDRTQFERALEQFYERNHINRRKAA